MTEELDGAEARGSFTGQFDGAVGRGSLMIQLDVAVLVVVVLFGNAFDKRKHINQGSLTKHAQIINTYQHIAFCPGNSYPHKRFDG